MKKLWIIGLFVVMGSGLSLAQSDAPSLGEIAKEKRGDKKATLVLTDEDRPTSAAPASAAGSSAATAETDKDRKASSETAKKDGKDSGSPSKDSPSVSELKKKLDSFKEQQDTWKRSVKRYQALLENETSDFRRQMYQDALDNDQKNVQLYQRNIDEVQAQVAKAK